MKELRFLLHSALIFGLGFFYHTQSIASESNHDVAQSAVADYGCDETVSVDATGSIQSEASAIYGSYADDVVQSYVKPNRNSRTATPITTEQFSIPDSIYICGDDNKLNSFVISISEEVCGKLKIRTDLTARLIPKDTDELGKSEDGRMKSINLFAILNGNDCTFYAEEKIPCGNWELDIPEGFFEIIPDFVEVDEFDFGNEDFANFNVSGAWHFKGDAWKGPGMFTVHDDDCLDGYIPSSVPSDYMTTGYYSMLYPILQSLGLRGCISMEGRRVGLTSTKAELNDNGKVALRLQNERGWEIQNHSMRCIGEILNNWVVDSLSSPLADEIIKKHPFTSIHQNSTSVYDRQTGRQYFPLPDNSGWQESPSYVIKPYAGDFHTKKPVLYNPDFDIDYHWGRFFRLAARQGIDAKCYVCYNSSSSHALIPGLNKVCPYGFADAPGMLYNVPPLMSTVTRIGLEGQPIKGYVGEMDPDNTFNQTHFDFFKKQIDLCRKSGGWIVFYTHMYRLCWKNYVPGALVSEGGTYPDEWVYPMLGSDPLNDSLDPPARLGISDWSEWYPCPGTRCEMIWKLFKYALDSGMINATSSEGFEKFGNKKNLGYFSYGTKIGQNVQNIEGTSTYYPHFVQGANNETFYYNPFVSKRITHPLTVSVSTGKPDIQVTGNKKHGLTAVSPTGLRFKIKSLNDLPKGLWIVNGQKIFVR